MDKNSQNLIIQARKLIRNQKKGVLSTTGGGGNFDEGHPLGSLVTYVSAWDGSPVFLFSSLSQHTKNLINDDRVCLLVDGTDNFINPQEGPRVSVLGTVVPTNDEALRQRFLSIHPEASLYADFGDFEFFIMDVLGYHLVGGFAQANWLTNGELVLSKSNWTEIANSENSIIDHMNSDHREALYLYAKVFLGKKGKNWSMVCIDPEGVYLCNGKNINRLDFDTIISSVDDYRRHLVKLARTARSKNDT